ncbi:MAG TPA: thioredoxin domain-containing protein, partial [Dehalococcoidia bacterium]|nr:thioredoxin domain-containing protein [Dehalococcoidia bacterium]
DFFDNATPSGASVAIDVLLRLAAITGKADYEERATVCLRTLTPFVEDAPTAFGRLLAALEFYLARSQELAVIHPNNPLEARALIDPVRLLYSPNLLLVGAAEGEGGDVSPLLQDRPALNGLPTAYVCERYVCQAPTTDPNQLLQQLQSLMP